MDEFIIIEKPEPEPKINWPVEGKLYTIEISVSHEGPNYDDIWYNVEQCPDEISDLISYSGLSFDELIDLVGVGELPIASGYYELVVEYTHDTCIDWESGYDEGGDYLIVKSCKRLRNLELDLIGM